MVIGSPPIKEVAIAKAPCHRKVAPAVRKILPLIFQRTCLAIAFCLTVLCALLWASPPHLSHFSGSTRQSDSQALRPDTRQSDNQALRPDWFYQPTAVKCTGGCCDGPQRNRSCLWSNLWYVHGTFYAVGTHEDRDRNGWANASDYVVLANPRRPGALWDHVHPLFQPVPKTFATAVDLRTWINESMASASFKMMNDGIVLPISRGAGYNFGHGILDELFPIFYSAVKIGAIDPSNDLKTFFTPVIMASSLQADPGQRPEQWIRAICGRDLQFEKQWPPRSIALVALLVSGHGHMGLSGISDTYTSPTGPEVDAMRMFRDRAYRGLGLLPPPRLVRPSDRFNSPSAKTLQVGIFANRRDFIGTDAISRLNDSTLLINGKRLQLRLVDFPHMDPRAQLEILGKLDVVFTAPGTSVCASFLLPDGAVVLLAGTRDKGFFGYMEEFFARGLYFIRTFYSGAVEFSAESAVQLLIQAHSRVSSDTATLIPIPSRLNSSPVGMILEEYFATDPALWMALVGAYFLNGPNEACLGWGERVVCGGSYRGCYSYNQTFMDSLRYKYKWECLRL